MSRATRRNVSGKSRRPLTKSVLRSAISRGAHELDNVDRRNVAMRRLRRLIGNHTSDLGGPSNISHSEQMLVQRASMMCLLAEMQEEQFLLSNMKISAKEMTTYLHLSGSLGRILSTLGLERRSKDVTPSLEEYLAGKARERQEAEGVDDAEVVDDA